MPDNRSNLYAVIREAIADFAQHGYDSPARLEHWLERLERAMEASLLPQRVLQEKVAEHLKQVFDRLTRRRGLMRVAPGVSEFTLRQIEPRLRRELDKRILASASLITLNRRASRERTLQRFAGWATSIPIGGSRAVDKLETAEQVRRGIAGLPFEERRVVIDQGHKLVASIHEVVAVDAGAIALIWHHVHEAGAAYEPRPEHVARDGKVYVIRENWAQKRGLMKADGHLYYDQVTAVAEEPFCRCTAEYLFNLRDLPAGMLTIAGKTELARVREIIRSA